MTIRHGDHDPPDRPPRTPRRTGFLKGQIDLPQDFDELGAEEIRASFDGTPVPPEGTRER
jgi:hypothetical protein